MNAFSPLGKIKSLENRHVLQACWILMQTKIPSHGLTVLQHYMDFPWLLTFSYRAWRVSRSTTELSKFTTAIKKTKEKRISCQDDNPAVKENLRTIPTNSFYDLLVIQLKGFNFIMPWIVPFLRLWARNLVEPGVKC